MADRTERATAQVFIDSTEAAYELEILKKKSKELKAEMDKAFKVGDKEGWMKLKKEADDLNGSMKKVKNTTVDVTRVMKNLNGTNLKDLQQAEKQLSNELKTMSRNTTEYVAKSKQLQQVSAEVRKVRTEMTELNSASSGGFFGKMAGGFNKYFGMATAALASITGLTLGVKKAVEAFNDFEKKMDNLSALTGLQGEELQYLSDQAKKLSVSTVDGGVRITQGADAIVDAYTKVGSARPELLKNKEALNQVTQEAIILSEAANGELQPAVDALAMVLNQFNAPATDARRIINALAAGSKEGAGEIPYLTTAIEKAGTVAADVGMNYEQLIGTIETLAPRITAPEIAGRSLKGVILDLQKTADDTNPAIVGFAQAIENLGKKQLSTNELMKIFGSENITVAKILIDNQNETKKYTDAVTGTNVALEQANINTDNNASKLAQAQNRAKLVAIELGEKLAPAMTALTGYGTKFLKVISALVDFFSKYKVSILVITAAIAGYSIGVAASIALDKLKDYWVNTLNKSLKNLFTTMKANPWGLIGAAISAAISYIIVLSGRLKDQNEKFKKLTQTSKEYAEAQDKINNVIKEIGDKYLTSSSDLELWYKSIIKTNTGSLERNRLINEFNEKFGEYNKKLLTEKSSIDEITTAYKNANDALRVKLSSEIAAETTKEAMKASAIVKSQRDVYEDQLDQMRQMQFEFANMTEEEYKNFKNGERIHRSKKDLTQSEIEQLKVKYAAIRKILTEEYNIDLDKTDANKNINKLIDEFQAKIGVLVTESSKLDDQIAKGIENSIALGEELSKITNNSPDNETGGSDATDKEKSAAEKAKKELKDKLNAIQAITQKYNQQFFEDILSEDEKELEQIKQKYDAELQTVGITEQNIAKIKAKGWANCNDLEKAMWTAYDANREAMHRDQEAKEKEQQDKINKAKLAAQEEIWQATLDGEEAEMVAAMQKYDKLFELAYQNGVDTTQLKEKMDKEIANIHQKYLDQEVAKTKEAEAEKRKARQKSLQTTADIAGGLLNIVNGIQQIELEKAGENEEKKKAIQKKYADIQMEITIGKIIAATALGAMKAYELGSIGGAIMSGVIIAEGAVEVGLAIAQRNKIKSLATGGPTGSGYGSPDESGYKVAGVVHQDEYVIPSWERKIPQVMAMERIIESIRVNKSGYAAGGSVQQPASISVQPQVVTYTDAAMITLLTDIHKELKKPTRAKVVYSDFTDMEAKVADVYSTFGK